MNIIFDLNGVIIKGKAKDVLDKLNLTKEEYNELVKFFDNWNTLDIDEETIEEKFNSYNFSNDIVTKYKDRLLKYYELRDYNMNLINLIKDLKKNNNKVYVLSDNNREASNYYKNVLKDVDGFVFSYEYKSVKKDGILFDEFLKKYNLDPSTCYFIDNTLENIEIAESKGMNGIFYEEDDKVINYFKERGII